MLISKFDTAGIEEKVAWLECRFGLELPEE